VRTIHLETVDACIAFDFDCPTSGGGTRLASDVSEKETQLLARAMTYKFGVLGIQMGGAKGTIRATPEERDDAVRRYVEEILPLVNARTFLTATDLGTYPEDFTALPSTDRDGLMHSEYSGMPLDAYITGLGVAVAAETALDGITGRTVAIEGFGKVGGATAKEMDRRGARLIAFSTFYGMVERPSGFDVDELLRLRAEHGDRLVEHLGVNVQPAGELFAVKADILVPGARIGVIDAARAGSLEVGLVAPAANVPYTSEGLETLRRRGIVALADFVCNSGATIGYVAEGVTNAEQALAAVEEKVRELTEASLKDPDGPHAGASRIAEAYLRGWVSPAQMPEGPPLA
jgi:glutamate dehydrogenase/leucine dehydrogenase